LIKYGNILDGKKLSDQIKLDLAKLVQDKNIVDKVGLAVVLVGDDPASHIYVNNKVKACQKIGIKSYRYHLASDTPEYEVLNLIDNLNCDNNIHGILVQLPLPLHLNPQTVINHINSSKDVDGLCQQNVFRLIKGYDCLKPCTPQGIMKLIELANLDLSGKHAVVVGRSDLVGKPISQILLQANCTVTTCHSFTKDLASITKLADILVVAVGKKHLITTQHIKKGAIVIDVGINKVDGKVYGDVDFENVKFIASYITPVPGGVGPMTIATLMSNVLKAAGYLSMKD